MIRLETIEERRARHAEICLREIPSALNIQVDPPEFDEMTELLLKIVTMSFAQDTPTKSAELFNDVSYFELKDGGLMIFWAGDTPHEITVPKERWRILDKEVELKPLSEDLKRSARALAVDLAEIVSDGVQRQMAWTEKQATRKSISSSTFLLIDRTEHGIIFANRVIASFPDAKPGFTRWLESDAEFLFVSVDGPSETMTFMTARDRIDLLEAVIPRLFKTYQAPNFPVITTGIDPEIVGDVYSLIDRLSPAIPGFDN